MSKLIIFLVVVLFSCSQVDEASRIVNQAIEVAGGRNFESNTIRFTFRDRIYSYKKVNGHFEYTRTWNDSSGMFHDVLSNDHFTREINGEQVTVADTMAAKYSNSINSVIYFALLPYGLNDPAVNKEYMGDKSLKDKDYYKIKVTFDKNGGGDDYEDVFYYWINKETYFVDYLAYEYSTDGGGMRFRKVFNTRIIGGIRFTDYINYEPVGKINIENIDDSYINDELKELSTILLEEIEVQPI